MLWTDLDFRLGGTTCCAKAQRISHETPLTPRVAVNVARKNKCNPLHEPYLGNAAIAPCTATPKTADINMFHCSCSHASEEMLSAS